MKVGIQNGRFVCKSTTKVIFCLVDNNSLIDLKFLYKSFLLWMLIDRKYWNL